MRTSRYPVLGAVAAGLLVLAATSASSAPTAPSFTAPSRADDPAISGTGLFASEPATIVDSHGVRYVANQRGSQLSLTRDGGRTWTHLPKGVLTRNVSGCAEAVTDDVGDVELATDQAGRTYFADLQIMGGSPPNDGVQPVVGRSDDAFTTYQATCSANQPLSVDREWMAAYTPPGVGADHTLVYMTYHDFGPDTMWVNVSSDGGKTWSTPTNVITDAGAQSNSTCDTIPAGVVVDPRNGWV